MTTKWSSKLSEAYAYLRKLRGGPGVRAPVYDKVEPLPVITMKSLDNYFKSPPPGYAVMLYGNWGVGKTYWWNKYATANLNGEPLKSVTISVAGLRTAEDLDRALFQASIKFAIAGLVTESSSVLGRAALRWLKVEPDDIVLKADLTTNKTVVCIDDMERFGGEFDDLFGFIVNLVEANKLHVVVIADEQNAVAKFPRYGSFKEKIIGRSMAISSNVLAFVDEEIKGLASDRSRDAITNVLKTLVETLNAKEIYNLRTVRAIVRELDGIVTSIETKHTNLRLAKLIPAICFWRQALARDMANLSLVTKAFTSTELGVAMAMRRNSAKNKGSLLEDVDPLFSLIEQTNFSVDAQEFPYSPSFTNYMLDLDTDFNVLANDFELLSAMEVAASAPPDALSALQHYRRYTDDEVQAFIANVWADFGRQSYTTLEDINAAYRTLNVLAERRLTPFSQEELVDSALKWLEEYPAEKLISGHFEDFGLNNLPIDIRVTNALSDLSRRFDDNQRKIEQGAVIDWILTGRGKSPDVRTEAVFVDASVVAFYEKMILSGKDAVHRAATLFGARLQVVNAANFVAEDATFARGLSIEIRRQLPEKGKLSVLQSELLKLADVLDEFAERMNRPN